MRDAMTLPPERDQPDPTTDAPPPATMGEMLARVPPGVIGGIIVIAAVVAVAVTFALRPKGTAVNTAVAPDAPATAPDTAAARATPQVPTDAAPFAFRLRDSRNDGSDCVMTFDVTAGTDAPWNITVDVMDAGGTALARDVKQVPSLAPGTVTEFRFRNADCDRIDSWEFQGETRKPGGG